MLLRLGSPETDPEMRIPVQMKFGERAPRGSQQGVEKVGRRREGRELRSTKCIVRDQGAGAFTIL